MDKQSHAQLSVWWNDLSISNIQPLHRYDMGMDEWFHLIMDIINSTCWD